MIRLFLALAVLSISLSAQDGATLRGRVRDPQQNAVPEAVVRLHRQDSGAKLRTTTNPVGEYVFEKLAPGAFILEVEKENFRGSTTSVRIEPGIVQAGVD